MRVANTPAWIAAACLAILPAGALAQQRVPLSTPASHYAPLAQKPAANPSPAATSSQHSPLPLAPRSAPGRPMLTKPAAPSVGGAVGTVVGSLGVVLGLFVVIAWVSRRFAPAGTSQLPIEAVELLGQAPLAGRQQLRLLRVGNKLLLVALSQTGIETLTEITEAAEVEHLIAMCRRSRPGSSQAAFEQVLGQLASEPAARQLAGASRTNARGAR